MAEKITIFGDEFDVLERGDLKDGRAWVLVQAGERYITVLYHRYDQEWLVNNISQFCRIDDFFMKYSKVYGGYVVTFILMSYDEVKYVLNNIGE